MLVHRLILNFPCLYSDFAALTGTLITKTSCGHLRYPRQTLLYMLVVGESRQIAIGAHKKRYGAGSASCRICFTCLQRRNRLGGRVNQGASPCTAEADLVERRLIRA